jgi:hypothetical protein
MTSPRHLAALGLVAALLSAACSSSPAASSGAAKAAAHDAGGTAHDSAPPKVALGPYPGGPYGNKVGDVLTNLKLQGYLNESGAGLASDQPWLDSYTMEDLRATGAKYALVHVSEFF